MKRILCSLLLIISLLLCGCSDNSTSGNGDKFKDVIIDKDSVGMTLVDEYGVKVVIDGFGVESDFYGNEKGKAIYLTVTNNYDDSEDEIKNDQISPYLYEGTANGYQFSPQMGGDIYIKHGNTAKMYLLINTAENSDIGEWSEVEAVFGITYTGTDGTSTSVDMRKLTIEHSCWE